jgi:hypothetical protein
MEFHQLFCNPRRERQALFKVMASAIAHPLLIGGANLGNYVLESVRATWNHVTAEGYLLHTGVECTLREYR